MKTKSGFTPFQILINNKVTLVDIVKFLFKRKRPEGFGTGFTLIEIIIVVAIVVTLATLAIPNVLRARHNANEMAAVASCRVVVTAAQNFYANATPHTYPGSFSDFVAPISDPPYIDDVLASGTKQGYNFTYTFIDTESFTLHADPVVDGKTGTRHFYADEVSVIKANPTAIAGPDDPVVE
ncbi:MAG: prepilin-type N-terminal cleavage/methylation domain-containing protein [Candidatus Omnitrophica bacterium]|nr:prepilin-type N-terminal cleavage/methylation domain-containing protein [Candidatus Omnitrophota bacterium]MBU1853392.1 prepilin-type N-terminal cleavage/methylation domain-containing protein [Candidatus Omnitrophota bacterium]